MKFKKVIAICKKSKRFLLYDCDGLQMLGDSAAAYELIGHPIYNEDSLSMVAEITDGAVSFEQKFEIPFNMNDSCAEDEECELFNTTFGYRGTVLQPVRSASGFAFLDSKYLTPFLGEDYTVWKRNSLYVIKVGLLAKAFICPVIIQNDTPLVKELNQIIDFVTIKRQKENTEEGNEQLVLN